jgi:hypothetical protein
MTFRDRNRIFDTLENLQEEPVLEALRKRLPEASRTRGVCGCDRCFIDMLAVALNALPPLYVADRFNKFPVEEIDEDRNRGLVERAVDAAIDRVAGRPKH